MSECFYNKKLHKIWVLTQYDIRIWILMMVHIYSINPLKFAQVLYTVNIHSLFNNDLKKV